jgi:hypothetical protein
MAVTVKNSLLSRNLCCASFLMQTFTCFGAEYFDLKGIFRNAITLAGGWVTHIAGEAKLSRRGRNTLIVPVQRQTKNKIQSPPST